MAAEEKGNIRLFVDADGRLTDLLSRLNIEIKQLRSIRGKARGFGFVEMNVADTEPRSAFTAGAETAPPSKHKTKPSKDMSRSKRRTHAINANALAHVIETFRSGQPPEDGSPASAAPSTTELRFR